MTVLGIGQASSQALHVFSPVWWLIQFENIPFACPNGLKTPFLGSFKAPVSQDFTQGISSHSMHAFALTSINGKFISNFSSYMGNMTP
jgi:hypothetical protein